MDKSTSGLQVGVKGMWLHNEGKIGNRFALRSELGFDTNFYGGGAYDKNTFVMALVLTLEPRWYYNLNKRSLKGKDISGNSGNFFSLKSSYTPDWFQIANHDNITIPNQVSVIPTWGIRRNLGTKFNYETGIGVGIRVIYWESISYWERDTVLNLHLRIGYRF